MNKRNFFIYLMVCSALVGCKKEEKFTTVTRNLTEYELRLIGQGTSDEPLSVMGKLEAKMKEEKKVQVKDRPLTTIEKLQERMQNNDTNKNVTLLNNNINITNNVEETTSIKETDNTNYSTSFDPKLSFKNTDKRITIDGEINYPDGTTIELSIKSNISEVYSSLVTVKDKKFSYTFELTTNEPKLYMGTAMLRLDFNKMPENVKKVFGSNGELLNDKDIIDTGGGKYVTKDFEIEYPSAKVIEGRKLFKEFSKEALNSGNEAVLALSEKSEELGVYIMKVTDIWYLLTDSEKKDFVKIMYDGFNDFSKNWYDKNAYLYIYDESNNLIATCSIDGVDLNPSKKSTSETIQTTDISNIKYTIGKIDDVSLGSVIREKVHVYATIPQGRDLNTSEIHDLLIRITNEYTSKKKINSLAIILSDDKRDFGLGLGYSLGFCEFDSYGKTENANKVKSGDYKTFTYKTTSLNREPYQNDRPTNEELEIYYYYNSIRNERLKKGLLSDEEESEIENKVANKFNISKDVSNKIINKVSNYKDGFNLEYKTVNWKDINKGI